MGRVANGSESNSVAQSVQSTAWPRAAARATNFNLKSYTECVDEASAGIAGSMQCKAIGLSACRDLQSDESAAEMSTPGAVGDAAHCAIDTECNQWGSKQQLLL